MCALRSVSIDYDNRNRSLIASILIGRSTLVHRSLMDKISSNQCLASPHAIDYI